MFVLFSPQISTAASPLFISSFESQREQVFVESKNGNTILAADSMPLNFYPTSLNYFG